MFASCPAGGDFVAVGAGVEAPGTGSGGAGGGEVVVVVVVGNEGAAGVVVVVVVVVGNGGAAGAFAAAGPGIGRVGGWYFFVVVDTGGAWGGFVVIDDVAVEVAVDVAVGGGAAGTAGACGTAGARGTGGAGGGAFVVGVGVGVGDAVVAGTAGAWGMGGAGGGPVDPAAAGVDVDGVVLVDAFASAAPTADCVWPPSLGFSLEEEEEGSIETCALDERRDDALDEWRDDEDLTSSFDVPRPSTEEATEGRRSLESAPRVEATEDRRSFEEDPRTEEAVEDRRSRDEEGGPSRADNAKTDSVSLRASNSFRRCASTEPSSSDSGDGSIILSAPTKRSPI